MVQQPRRDKRRRKFLGSHQRAWIWGRYPVLETLRAGFWKPLELRLSTRLPEPERVEVEARIAELELSARFVDPDELTVHCGTTEHQGYAARMPPFPYRDANDVVQSAVANPIFVVLDGIQDPHNFGAIVRTADAMAIDGLFVGTRGQSEITSQVVRSSAGAVNHVPIAAVESLVEFVRQQRERGFQIAAASEENGRQAADCDFKRPTLLIIGNEGSGVRSELLELCEVIATIPQFGHVGSLNAAVSAGILFYEARRQRTDLLPNP
ncbi:MAG: TrmH family RNA methyltransferase [Planctomycetaceae bacterium]